MLWPRTERNAPPLRGCNAASNAVRNFAGAQGGNFTITAALLLPVLMGFSALAIEFGTALLTRSTNQRVADIAAFTGALEYSAGKSETSMRASALRAAEANGIGASHVAVTLVPAPRGEGNAVHVRIATTSPIVLGSLLGGSSELLVSAESYAAIGSAEEPTCILALDGTQSGIILSGGTSLSATTCSVASNATIDVPCGTSITTKQVYYNTKPPSQGCGGIKAPDGSAAKTEKKKSEDPLKGNASVTSATARLTQVAAMALPAPPPPPTNKPAITFSWGNAANVQSQVAAAGCTVTGSAPSWVVTCPGSVLNLGSIVVDGATVKFDVASTTAKTFNIAGSVTVLSAGNVTFGDGTFNIRDGINVNSSIAKFGKGVFRVGPVTADCSWNAKKHSICTNGGSTLTFGGPSDFELSAGLHAGDDVKLTLGSGSTNRFALGAASDGVAMALVGGSNQTIMGDALGAPTVAWPNSNFLIKGHINGTSGGSCFIVSASAHHDIAGSFYAAGAVILGAGIYTIDGTFLMGSNYGGSAPCGGSTVSLRAIDVTLVVSGKNPVNSGTCANQAFCVSNGYNNIVIKAPTSGPTAGLAVIGPTDGKKSGASLVAGASNATISGAFYFPTGPIIMGGGASLGGGGASSCLQLIGSRVELSGGASAASDCLGGVGGSRTRVVLIQ